MHHFFSRVIQGIEKVANLRGYNIMICVSNESYDKELLNIEMLANGSVDGLLISLAKETQKMQDFKHFDELLENHQLAWQKLWDIFDLSLEGDAFSQKALRFNIFHLLQTVSLNTAIIDAGFPARGLHGESYRGHIFWDKVFAMPFYNFHLPKISQALLLYRFRRLSKARKSAKKNGYAGAMFPWQSASSGEEETQVIHLNPLSGKWDADYSNCQRHISFAIAYDVWTYYKYTQDDKFIIDYGAELFLSIAQFAASLVYYNQKDRRYHTRGIMGPDEFHEKFSGARFPGLKDNAYSNVMISWVLAKALELIKQISKSERRKIVRKLKLKERDIKLWDEIGRAHV